MGSVGNKSESYYDFKDNPTLSTNNVSGHDASEWWQEHTEMSNLNEWADNLITPNELGAVESWVGASYDDLADLYTTEWDDLDSDTRKVATDLFNALNKFELKKGITVNRNTNFMILGAERRSQKMTEAQVKNYLENYTDNGLIQSDGFMSFSTRTNGVAVAGSGLVIHLNVPPNKGGGAYISTVGGNPSEREYLVNNNSIMKFDSRSVRTDEKGNVHVNAKLVGRAQMQTVDSKNNSKFRKEPKPKF